MNGLLWIVVAVVVAGVLILVLRGGGSPERKATSGAYDEVRKRLAGARRSTFEPVVETTDVEGPVSKFGGLPWLPEGSAWPACGGCKKPMYFFAQLDVASLPAAAGVKGSGLLQLFMCANPDTKADVCLDSWQHGAASALVRLVDSAGAGANAQWPEVEATWPPRRIVGWTEHEDYPGYEDFELAGFESEDELIELWEAAADDDRPSLNREGDKVGGWPYWVQSPEYGRCSECGKQMQLVLQLDSEINVPYMFGDSGAGHVCQCPDHPHVLTWGWACY